MLELVLVVWLWDKVGFANMLLLVFGTGIVGALIARKNAREAFKVLLDGKIPSSGAARQIFDAVAFFIAAALLIIPGIISDIAGLLLILPFMRKILFDRYVREIFPVSGRGQGNKAWVKMTRTQSRQVAEDKDPVIDVAAEAVEDKES